MPALLHHPAAGGIGGNAPLSVGDTVKRLPEAGQQLMGRPALAYESTSCPAASSALSRRKRVQVFIGSLHSAAAQRTPRHRPAFGSQLAGDAERFLVVLWQGGGDQIPGRDRWRCRVG
jgi:hypothetical protein